MNDPAPLSAESESPAEEPRAEKPTDPQPSDPLWDDERPLPLKPQQQVILVLVMTALVVVLAWHWTRLQGWGLKPVEIDRPAEHQFDYQIEINSATWVEWIQLPGIGKPTAEKIIAERETNGPFQSVDDLLRVNGIGEKKLDDIRPWLRLDSTSLPDTITDESLLED